MLSSRLYKSFSTELTKIAAEILDADIRKLKASREGDQTYLEGGELPSNDRAFYFPNYGAGGVKVGARGSGLTTMYGANVPSFKADKKDDTPYQAVRDWGWRGVQGGATGAGLHQLANNMRVGTGHPMGAKGFRKATAAGAAIALGDRAWRHRHEMLSSKQKEASLIAQNPAASFQNPASALSNAGKSGKFESSLRHTESAPKPIQMGNKFRLPGAL